ncbi:ABC transporter ATP-binding protein [Actinomadura sp. ATCC 31491]|uniref:ABC transporter ATP-binding protein n=1 Tax=Actinomadura luzonensis TaxID=2805427 RepID=A0ABT0G704_9ACTN|nr:ABC transporter ATP-binding protein [Actinomadura luzonensis]MCK2219886.1 ABC transporter ATP-binding protein [Actinomadura luzonensis]
MSDEPLVLVEGLRKVYRSGPKEVVALREVSFAVRPGELVAVRGRSGSGKTTLLNQIGGLDRPDAGRVLVSGQDVTAMSEEALLELRRDVIGFVFQSFGLIPVLSAAENVGVPMRLVRMPADEREARVRMLLALVGLEQHANQRPFELSGGQRQRVAIARSLANRPRLLVADEPTGQLDSQTGRQIMELLRALVRSEGVTALVATHDPSLITLADRVLEIRDGIVHETAPTT